MRQAGTLAIEADARRLADYLLTLGIAARVETAGDGWALWIVDEKKLAAGKQELEAFRVDPTAPRYDAAGAAEALRREAAAEAKKAQRNTIVLGDRWKQRQGQGSGRLTMLLVACSALVAMATDLGKKADGPIGSELFIATEPNVLVLEESPAGLAAAAPIDVWQLKYFGLGQIARGELWRLVTPIFLHFGLMHLVFNMLALLQLGGLIEARQGAWRLLAIVLLAAVVSNLAQYFHRGPNFGGMSGVVFALFGYAWMQGRFVPGSGLSLPGSTVFLCLLWLVACSVQDRLQVANMAHGAGFGVGLALGLAPRWLRVR